jgi:hypothetical protein
MRCCCCVLFSCRRNTTDAYALPAAEQWVDAAAAANGSCGIRVATNRTLVPTLLEHAAVSTQQRLLIILPGNVSLGRGLGAGSIQIRRCAACAVLVMCGLQAERFQSIGPALILTSICLHFDSSSIRIVGCLPHMPIIRMLWLQLAYSC